MGDSFGELRPYAAGFRAEVEIDFANPVIGRQSYVLDLSPERFRREICRARTFGCMNDVARLWSAGFALGASFENSVVFDETRLLNTEGLRYSDECARHKVLDVIGDLALAGLPLLGAYRSVRGGHKLNHAVLTALMADRSAWRVVEAETARRSARSRRSRQRNGGRHGRPGLRPRRFLTSSSTCPDALLTCPDRGLRRPVADAGSPERLDAFHVRSFAAVTMIGRDRSGPP